MKNLKSLSSTRLSPAVMACAALLAAAGNASAQAVDDPFSTQESNAIRSAIMEQRAAPFANTHFRLSLGNIAPRNVALQRLPPDILQAHPSWRGYMYFVAGDQIAIVEPGTLRIVSVLPA
jgi:hypothetical protein